EEANRLDAEGRGHQRGSFAEQIRKPKFFRVQMVGHKRRCSWAGSEWKRGLF
ncbi:hypothetical protein HAX54_008249, partial [Datura stramonium]|nr:hypothetical protein [Datura stramonium]